MVVVNAVIVIFQESKELFTLSTQEPSEGQYMQCQKIVQIELVEQFRDRRPKKAS